MVGPAGPSLIESSRASRLRNALHWAVSTGNFLPFAWSLQGFLDLP
jgi:hypothetical protein